MNKNILILALAACFTGCGTIFSTETSWRFVMAPRVEPIAKEGVHYIRVGGHLLSSSNAVWRISCEKISNTEIWVHVKESLATNKNPNGAFDIHVPISENTERIYFGREKTLIWLKK